jgi:hypothetical protein
MTFKAYLLVISGSYVRPNICAPEKNLENAVNNFSRCLIIGFSPKLETCNEPTIIGLLTFDEFASVLTGLI